MQIIDCALLDIQILQHKNRPIALSVMYLVLGLSFGQFTQEQICQRFAYTMEFLDPGYMLNEIFADYLMNALGYSMDEIAPTIQYMSSFFSIELRYDMPPTTNINSSNVSIPTPTQLLFLQANFEEFLAFQTHHPGNLEYIRERFETVQY